MKTQILVLVLGISICASAANTNTFDPNAKPILLEASFVPDTLLTNSQKVERIDSSNQQIIQETDEAFSGMESELEDMNSHYDKNDTTKIRIGKTKISIIEDGDDIIINKNNNWDDDDWDDDWSYSDDNDFSFSNKKRKNHFKPHWAGLSLGLNNYVTSHLSTNLPSGDDPDMQLLAVNTNNSLEFNLNIAQFGVNLFNQNIGLASGVGFKWNNYKYRNTNTVLVSDSTPLYYYEDPDKTSKFSKLSTCYLIIPILLEFQIHTQDEPLYLSMGVETGIKLGAWTKRKGNNDTKLKDKSDFHTVPWDYRLTARIGYGHFGLFTTYGMQSIFEKDKGPELHTVTVGISLNF